MVNCIVCTLYLNITGFFLSTPQGLYTGCSHSLEHLSLPLKKPTVSSDKLSLTFHWAIQFELVELCHRTHHRYNYVLVTIWPIFHLPSMSFAVQHGGHMWLQSIECGKCSRETIFYLILINLHFKRGPRFFLLEKF